ncbi:galactokinase family protein [Corynebacterium suedekumii]|nr:galactokinase family protein [Corynebacterium suedekumii]
MPMWPTADSPALDRVVAAHREATGVEATHAADAPATWLLMGEHVDYAGGVVLVGQAAQRVAVAFSPARMTSSGSRGTSPGRTPTPMRSAPGRSRSGRPASSRESTPAGAPPLPAPEGGLAARLAGIVWTMIHRQLLSRDTAGLDVTVVDDIPAGAGLGANASLEAAFALALQGDAEDIDDALMRARLAEVCAQSAEMFSEVPPLRARHTTALRGVADAVSVIDYADGSVTHAPHPLSAGVSFCRGRRSRP